jgi:hypothetical protein
MDVLDLKIIFVEDATPNDIGKKYVITALGVVFGGVTIMPQIVLAQDIVMEVN